MTETKEDSVTGNLKGLGMYGSAMLPRKEISLHLMKLYDLGV